ETAMATLVRARAPYLSPDAYALVRAVEVFADEAERQPDAESTIHRASALLFECAHVVAAMERAGWKPDDIRDVLETPRALMGRSMFIRRLQEWPRGYPGDFESIEILLGARESETTEPVGRAFEKAALRTAVALQHRFKIL